jgi:deazaflavin-dependent oxidoreductase (nitroreductase family)
MNGSTFQQRDAGFMTYPTDGWRKLMFKAPLVLWRLGLGPLVGRIFVLITQTGRKSGLPRRTMTEVHVVNGRKYAPCAFGERAQWYKNIQADPLVTIQTADGVERVTARRVTDGDELLAVFQAMRAKNPMADKYLDSLDIRPTAEDIHAKKDRIYILTFDPTDQPTPPPQEADLTWVWSVLGTLLSIMIQRYFARRRQRREAATEVQ